MERSQRPAGLAQETFTRLKHRPAGRNSRQGQPFATVETVSDQTTTSRRPVGRPRTKAAAGGTPEIGARAEIVAVASRLFAAKGVSETTMAEIADGAGLQQSSLYYYFRSRDAILEEILGTVNRVPLEFVERLKLDGGPAAVRLHRLIRFDVAALSEFPFDINEVHRLASRQPEGFDLYWEERQRLNDEIEALVAEGVEAGEFLSVDPRLTAMTLLANDEAVQHWNRGRRRLANRPVPDAGDYTSAEIGLFLADLALRGLLARPARLEAVRRASLAQEAGEAPESDT
jgi:TetR/AcrR family transcriptional regulator